MSFSPYDSNGGTILGIAGAEFAVLAGDTRQTTGYSINSRFEPKVFEVGDNILVAVNGFAADGLKLVKKLRQEIEWYHFRHNKPMSIHAASRLITQLLYSKRFFPYYVATIIAGLDEQGRGAVYSYDPVGSCEREDCRAGGAAASLVMPFLDNQVKLFNQIDPSTGEARVAVALTVDETTKLVKDAFDAAVERHIEVGDGLQVSFVSKDGIRTVILPLKRD